MNKDNLTYYDIYGFILAVDPGMKKAFDLEYWRFNVKGNSEADLYILKTDKKNLPIKLRLAEKGISIPFDFSENKENVVWYEPGVPGDWVLYTIEPLINWKDKCFLHCGAVEKDGKAIIFPAEGGVGKTTMAIYLVSRGYNYLSDDWLVAGKDGKAYPFYKTIHVFDYNLKKDRPMAKRVLGWKRFGVFVRIRLLELFQKLVPHRFVRIFVERFMPIFSIDIEKLHPNAKIGSVTPIDKVYWLKKDYTISKPYLKAVGSKEVADKLAHMTALETHHFYKNYLEWVYTNSEQKSIQNKIEKDKKILEGAFSKAENYELFVPDKINPKEVAKLLSLD